MVSSMGCSIEQKRAEGEQVGVTLLDQQSLLLRARKGADSIERSATIWLVRLILWWNYFSLLRELRAFDGMWQKLNRRNWHPDV